MNTVEEYLADERMRSAVNELKSVIGPAFPSVRFDLYTWDDPDGLYLEAMVDLDETHYALLRDCDARFPAGPPSLVGARSLTVHGDWTFGRGVVVSGDAVVGDDADSGGTVPDGTELSGPS